MFGRVRRLMAKAEAELNHAHRTMDSAQLTLELAKALIADIQDGVAVRAQFDPEAAKTLVGLLTGKAADIPITVTIDPEYDTHPSEIAKFVGGHYDGQAFRIPAGSMASGEITLSGGHKYKWDGKVFRYESAN